MAPREVKATKKGLRLIDVNPYAANVPETGLEPALSCDNQALNLARLPIPPLRLALD
jgi:hypothetical protein